MYNIYGHLSWQQHPDQPQEQLTQMMAARADYPWADGGVCALSVQDGGGSLAVQASGETGRTPAQPLCRDGVSIVADVRLDNRAELLSVLGIDPTQGQALSDPELLLYAYHRWNVEVATHLLGDFAFALWDEARQRLFCARDFVGVCPFYYFSKKGQDFIWASDLQALLAHPRIPSHLNLAYVKAELLAMGQFQHPAHTYYADVEKLPPAHCLTVDRTGLRTWAYWQPGGTPERRYPDEVDYVAELRQILQEAVACRVRDSVHGVGAHLSGGLDSSSMAVLAHQELQKEGRSATAFSWAPPFDVVPTEKVTESDDERPLVEAVAQAEELPLRYTVLTPEHPLAYARRDITIQPTTTLHLELSTSQDAANLGIRTMLSGWGGDELLVFNGRGYFPHLFRRGRWATLQREFAMQSQIHGGTVWKKWVNNGVRPLVPDAIMRQLRPEDYPPPPTLPTTLRPDFAAALAHVEPLTRPELGDQVGVRPTQIALLNYGHIPYRLESWAAHGASLGITYAFPLLDKRIVEFALSIPDYFFFKDGWKRYLYRTAMEGILPDRVRWHKVKEDPAMVEQSRRVHKVARPQLDDELRSKATNPFVDTDKILAAQKEMDSQTETLPSNSDQRTMRRARRARQAAMGGQWLAWMDSGVTY